MSLVFSVGIGSTPPAQRLPPPPPVPVVAPSPVVASAAPSAVTLREAARLGYSIQLGAIGGDEYEAIVTHDRVEVRGLGPTPREAEAKAVSLYAAYLRAKAAAGDGPAVAWRDVR